MWPNPQFPADLVAFTKAILNGKLNYLCGEWLYVGGTDLRKYGKQIYLPSSDLLSKIETAISDLFLLKSSF